jgi:hypothetical protein
MCARLLLCFYFLFLLCGCEQEIHDKEPPPYERKVCNFKTDNLQQRIYNDVLIELVETATFQHYLAKSLNYDSLFRASALYEPKDSSEIYAELTRINRLYSQHQEAIFNNPDLWCTVYLHDQLDDFFLVLRNDKSQFDKEIGDALPLDSVAIKNYIPDTLQLKALKLDYKKFQSCTFKVAPISDIKPTNNNCYIGEVRFSTILLNKAQTKGWLYYEFRCGDMCGRGAYLTIEQVNSRWIIKKSQITYVS